jgi:CubicO group peptidase (beta-lactamase class C family)
MPDAQAPAGGNSSTAGDLARWLRLMLGSGELDGKTIIEAEALAGVTTPAITKRPPPAPGAPAAFYGLGWNIEADAAGHQRWNHSGAFSVGAATTAVLIPALDVAIVVLTNAQPVGAAEAIADAFMEVVETGSVSEDWVTLWGQRFGGIYGVPTELPAADPSLVQRGSSAYVGTFANDYAGEISVVESDAGLAIVMGPEGQVQRPLAAIDGATFSFVPDPELPGFAEFVRFEFDADGVANVIKISMFDGVGHGALPRR